MQQNLERFIRKSKVSKEIVIAILMMGNPVTIEDIVTNYKVISGKDMTTSTVANLMTKVKKSDLGNNLDITLSNRKLQTFKWTGPILAIADAVEIFANTFDAKRVLPSSPRSVQTAAAKATTAAAPKEVEPAKLNIAPSNPNPVPRVPEAILKSSVEDLLNKCIDTGTSIIIEINTNR